MPERRCADCAQAPLSKYNPGNHCAACEYRARTRFPAWAWDTPAFRAALTAGDPGQALAAIRTAAGMSQPEFAALLGWAQPALSKIERGKTGSVYDVRELCRIADALCIPRTAFGPLLGIQPTADAVANTPAAAPPPAQGLPHGKISAAHVRWLRATVDRYIDLDQQVGGGVLVREAAGHYRYARTMLESCEYPSSIARELLSVTGNLAIGAGWLAFDAGEHELATTYTTEALALAAQAEDAGLTAHALQNLTLLALQAHAQGRSTAQRASQLSGRAAAAARHEWSPRLQTLICAREAVTSAALGDRRGYTENMAQAKRELDRCDREPLDDAPRWLRFVTPAEITFHEARGMALLGDVPAAAQISRGAADDQDTSPRNSTSYRALLARTLASIGDMSGALTAGMAVLDAVDEGVSSWRVFESLVPVRRKIGRSTAAQEFRLRFDAATSASEPAGAR